MVNRRAAEDAVRLAAERPRVSLGLHANFTDEADAWWSSTIPRPAGPSSGGSSTGSARWWGACPPTSTRTSTSIAAVPAGPFPGAGPGARPAPEGQPPVIFKGGFYGQWEYGVSDPSKVSLEALQRILRNELRGGVYELAVHPGYADAPVDNVYHRDRELELATLCDPALPEFLDEQGICLIGFSELPGSLAPPADVG